MLLCEAYAAEVRSRGHVPIFTEMTRRVIMELAKFLTDGKDCRFSENGQSSNSNNSNSKDNGRIRGTQATATSSAEYSKRF